jgi:hypothetical protein
MARFPRIPCRYKGHCVHFDNQMYHFEEGVTTPIPKNHRGPFPSSSDSYSSSSGCHGTMPGMVSPSPRSNALVLAGSPWLPRAVLVSSLGQLCYDFGYCSWLPSILVFELFLWTSNINSFLLKLESFFFLKIYLFIIWKYTVVVFRYTRREHQISLRVVVSHHVVAGIWTLDLWKSSRVLLPTEPSHQPLKLES